MTRFQPLEAYEVEHLRKLGATDAELAELAANQRQADAELAAERVKRAATPSHSARSESVAAWARRCIGY